MTSIPTPVAPIVPINMPTPQETDDNQPQTSFSEGWGRTNAAEMMMALSKTAPKNDVVLPKITRNEDFWLPSKKQKVYSNNESVNQVECTEKLNFNTYIPPVECIDEIIPDGSKMEKT